MRRQHSNGSTLIELSIVLVIISLVVGGIFVGRDLIQAAEIRSTVAQFQKFQTAVATFKLKYQALPGDMLSAQANASGFQPTARVDTAASPQAYTHGNGLVEAHVFGVSRDAGGLASEACLFWQDLSSAQLIPFSFTSALEGDNAISLSQLASYIPPSPLN